MSEQILDSDAVHSDTLEEKRFASFGLRVLASILDSLFMLPIAALQFYNYISTKSILIHLLSLLLLVLYKPILEWRYKGTLGKMVVGIKVAYKSGGEFGMGQSFLRGFLFYIGSLINGINLIQIFSNSHFQETNDLLVLIDLVNSLSSPYLQYGLLVITFISVTFMFSSEHNQCLHDKLGGSVVLKK